MGLELITGLGISSAVFLYLLFKINGTENGGDHTFLRIFLLASALFSLYLIPAAVNESLTTCEYLQSSNSQTIVLNVTTTNYTYVQQCTTATSGTQVIFQKLVSWFARILATYIALYFGYYYFIETTSYKRWFGTQ